MQPPFALQELKHRTEVTLNIVHCSPVTTAVIRRPDTKYQLGFCVENGVVSAVGGSRARRGLPEVSSTCLAKGLAGCALSTQ